MLIMYTTDLDNIIICQPMRKKSPKIVAVRIAAIVT